MHGIIRTLLLNLVLLFTGATECWSECPPVALVQRLTDVIRQYCPDAAIETTKDQFTAKYGTMIFTLHGKQKTGEISPGTYQEEGPNFKGFILKVSVQKGPYAGQAVIPQELRGPYYPTFIDAPTTDEGTTYYWISFSYGSRLNPKFRQAILDALPKREVPANGRVE